MDTFILILGFSLITVDSIMNGQSKAIWNIIYNPSVASTDITGVKKDLLVLSGEAAFVVILSIFSRYEKSVAGMSIALFLGLWFLWFMKNGSVAAQFFSKLVPAQFSGQPIGGGISTTGKQVTCPSGSTPVIEGGSVVCVPNRFAI